mgnify:FL=1
MVGVRCKEEIFEDHSRAAVPETDAEKRFLQKERVRTDACPALKDTICRSEIRPKYDVTGGLTREVQAFVLLQDGSLSF